MKKLMLVILLALTIANRPFTQVAFACPEDYYCGPEDYNPPPPSDFDDFPW